MKTNTQNNNLNKNQNQKNFEERLANLNPEQRLAVDTTDGPVMVIAGPGTGKTELLALRTANILINTQTSPQNILLLTFTESGASNMRERLVNLIGESAYRVAIYTFHAFAGDVMNKYAEHYFDGASYKPATDIDKLKILESILENLSRDNKLSSKHPDMGYTYQSDIVSCISGLKKGNISPEDFKIKISILEKETKEINDFAGEMLTECSGSRKFDLVFSTFGKIYEELEKLANQNNNNYAKYLQNTLSLELLKSGESGDHKNLNSWRDEYFTKNTKTNSQEKEDKDENDLKILKDSRSEKISKWYELCDVYEKYIFEMNKNGLYDFDDMIFLTAKELERNVSLRNELEEKYQYIMIDEFQDTNDAQLSLVKNMTLSPINEGMPNVLVVGDDNQAIYKFQGAELDNIFKFKNMYANVKTVVLDKNYRSTQNILDYSKNIMLQIEDRLDMRDTNINKDIKANNKKFLEKIEGGKIGNILEETFENDQLELDYIAKEIQKLLADGVNPEEISVISKKHQSLKNLTNVLNIYNIPYSYEKREHVLEKKHINELINIVYFLLDDNENKLPEILSYNFWGLNRLDIWNIAEKVKAGVTFEDEIGVKIYKKVSWLAAMQSSENVSVQNIAKFLIELKSDAKDISLEALLDKIIGTTEYEYVNEYDDSDNGEDIFKKENISKINKENNNFTSPYKTFYFGKENFEHNKPEYLEFLFALRTFIGALREFRQGKMLNAVDLIDFVNIYKNNDKMTLTLRSPFATSDKAITLQTAYKAKGLEYEYVFIINADEKEWNGRGVINKIGMPENLKLLHEGDNNDDKLRLLYVAMTRAKHTLYVTHSKEKLSYILKNSKQDTNIENIENQVSDLNHITKEIVQNMQISMTGALVEDEKILLKRLLENYKMPVTHLTNFLNLGKVGPEKFIEQNLLRFPQAMSSSSAYGSAMHAAMQAYYLYFKKYEKVPSVDKVKEYFENSLLSYGLSEIEYEKYKKSGNENLEVYIKDLENRNDGQDKAKISDMVEVNFANEGVHIGEVNASGKIDKMQFVGDVITVTDLKTGKSFYDWNQKGINEYDKIKMHFFKYQLAYYKLLIKNSRSYHNHKVDIGKIEFLECDNINDKNPKINILELNLSDSEGIELCNRVSKLSNIVYNKIINLEFPDTKKWTHDENGNEKDVKLSDILEFEEELLSDEILKYANK